MGKGTKRPARDLHADIRAKAEALRKSPAFSLKNAELTPELAALLQSARERVESCVPAEFEHGGRVYYMRVRLSLILDVFDTPGAAESLVTGATFSTEGFGHAPGH